MQSAKAALLCLHLWNALATGNRINSSADDAAGKQIANRLTAQSSGMGVALSNINDATAMLQTADSMFDEMSDVLGRMKDLSTQAANGTYSDDDLQAMQDEYDELGQQMSDMLQKHHLRRHQPVRCFRHQQHRY